MIPSFCLFRSQEKLGNGQLTDIAPRVLLPSMMMERYQLFQTVKHDLADVLVKVSRSGNA